MSEFVPYGSEWRAAMMKHTKLEIIIILTAAIAEKDKQIAAAEQHHQIDLITVLRAKHDMHKKIAALTVEKDKERLQKAIEKR